MLSDADLAKVTEFARYKDVDGDGICYRTLPMTTDPKGVYFTRGTGHTDAATYSEKPKDWKNNIDRLARKFDTARTLLPKPILRTAKAGKAKVGIIAFGSSDPAVEEARTLLDRDESIPTDYLRLRALPIGDETKKFIESHRVTYVVEQNRDAQCAQILRLEMPRFATTIQSVLHYDGFPLDAQSVIEQVVASESAKEKAKS